MNERWCQKEEFVGQTGRRCDGVEKGEGLQDRRPSLWEGSERLQAEPGWGKHAS